MTLRLSLTGQFAFALAILTLVPGLAAAEPFGGFSRDNKTYLAGQREICKPLAVKAGGAVSGVPSCTKAEVSEVAAAGFARARSGGLRASFAGRTLTVESPDGTTLVTWEAPAPISSVVAVYASESGGLVAVDYVVRRLGRSGVDVVGFALPAGAVATAPAANTTDGAVAPGRDAKAASEGDSAARDKAEALLRRRQWAKAASAFEKVVEQTPGDLRARYGLAVALARQEKRAAQAVEQLEAIAASGDPSAIEWLVDARRDPAFKRLRRRAAFRKAVAGDPKAPTSAYERLVGKGNVWMQPVDPCEEAGVKIELDQRARTFSMRLDIRCSTSSDRVFLGGTWSARGADELVLVFPNDGDADETVVCKLKTCEGGADCVSCALEDGLSFELRQAAK